MGHLDNVLLAEVGNIDNQLSSLVSYLLNNLKKIT